MFRMWQNCNINIYSQTEQNFSRMAFYVSGEILLMDSKHNKKNLTGSH